MAPNVFRADSIELAKKYCMSVHDHKNLPPSSDSWMIVVTKFNVSFVRLKHTRTLFFYSRPVIVDSRCPFTIVYVTRLCIK